METDESLLVQLKRLYDSWPQDGWDGAAEVIARHAARARDVESQLAARHAETSVHDVPHPYYHSECACRAGKLHRAPVFVSEPPKPPCTWCNGTGYTGIQFCTECGSTGIEGGRR